MKSSGMGGQEYLGGRSIVQRDVCALLSARNMLGDVSFDWWIGGRGQRVVEFDCGSLGMCKRSQKSSLNHGGLCMGSLGQDGGRMLAVIRGAHFPQQPWLLAEVTVSTRRGRCHILHRLQKAVNLMPIIFFLTTPKKLSTCPALAARGIVFGF